MSEKETSLPSLFVHCRKIWARMAELSETVDVEGHPTSVYRGHLTKLVIKEQGLSVPYYTQVMQALKAMGCVRQLRRGGGNAKSIWELKAEPTEERWKRFESTGKTPAAAGKTAVLEQQVRDINRRLQSVEATVQLLTDTGTEG